MLVSSQIPKPTEALPRQTREKKSFDSDVMEAMGNAIRDEVCMNLGYGDHHRVIVPESIRVSRAGNLLLMAKRLEEGEVVDRCYRVDRIQSAEVVRLSAQAMIGGAAGAALSASWT